MDMAVDETNKALIWFFACYVLGVGVLFSNLFVGILIGMFQFGTECFKPCANGKVQICLSTLLLSPLFLSQSALVSYALTLLLPRQISMGRLSCALLCHLLPLTLCSLVLCSRSHSLHHLYLLP